MQLFFDRSVNQNKQWESSLTLENLIICKEVLNVSSHVHHNQK